MSVKMIIPKGTKIYRYDIVSTPKEWSDDYKNLEYAHCVIDGYKKNHVGFFFFFDNQQVTENTATVACNKYDKKEYALTECILNSNLKLLDLTGCANTSLMIMKLKEAGIDILTDDYHIYTHPDCPPLTILKEPFEYILGESTSPLDRSIALIQKYNNTINGYLNPIGYPYSILGQTVSDYANGIKFKEELIAHGYDGYCFDESIGGHTICLLNSTTMSKPSKMHIVL